MTTHLASTSAGGLSTEPSDRLVRVASSLLAVIPFVSVGLFCLFAWQTSRTFGAWPTYGSPDPKDANTLLYASTGITAIAALPAAAAVTIGLPILRRFRLQKLDVVLIATAIAGCVALIALFAGDLGNWYVD